MFGKFINKVKVLLGDRSLEKDYALLKAALEDTGSCIVCANNKELKYFESIIKSNDWTIEVMTFNQFINKEFVNTDIKSFYFSDVDKIFRGFVNPRKVKMMTVTRDDITCI
jgi:hypothetical protein